VTIQFDSANLFEPTAPTERPELDYERECHRRAIVLEACAADEGLQQFELQRCKGDPWYWMRSYLWVLRPDLVDALGVSELPYLGWPKHHEIVKRMMGLEGYRTPLGKLRHGMVKKSRDTGISVCSLGVITHGFVFGKNETSFVISLRRDAVDTGKPDSFNETLFGKIRFFLEHLPVWMRPSPWVDEEAQAARKRKRGRPRKPRLWDSVCHITNPDNGCSIVGSSTTPNATRSARARHILVDEADSIPFLGRLIAAVVKVGPTWLVSSVTDSDTPFAQAYQGETGLHFDNAPTAAGWLQETVMYTDRPDWNPATVLGAARIAEMRKDMNADDFATEMECKFRRVSAGSIWGPYIPESAFLSEDEERAWLRAAAKTGDMFPIEGWDYGDGNALSAWVMAYFYPAQDIVFFADYMLWDDTSTINDMISDLAAKGWGPQSRPAASVGDGSGGAEGGKRTIHGIEVENARSWLRNMSDAGIETNGLIIRSARKMRDAVRDRFRAGTLVFSATCSMRIEGKSKWPSLAEAVKRFRLDAEKSPEENKKAKFRVRKDINSHPSDALSYIVWAIDAKGYFEDQVPPAVLSRRGQFDR
jgi:hypothetical protein